MRLNTSSMDKLYDLMTMGCKYQLVSCAHPLDLYQVCLNHLDALRVIVRNSPDVLKLVEAATQHIEQLFKNMRIGDLYLLRYTLARFFQDRRVKVSLFLTDHLQAQDGSMIHTHSGRMPIGTEKPGVIRYFDNGMLKREDVIKVPNAEGVLPTNAEVDISRPGRPCELGTNLYAKDRRKKMSGNAAANNDANSKQKNKGNSSSPDYEVDDASKAAAKSELNLLAQMLGSAVNSISSPTKENEKFSIVNLFPDTSLDFGAGGQSEAKADIICFDVEDRETRQNALAAQFANLNVDADNNQTQQDDLLDLMDQNQGQQYDD